MKTPKTILFNGHKYGWSGHYYTLYNYGKSKAPTTLQRAVWEFHNGAIPEGCHIHHKDEDPKNNHIDNLECLTVSEHMKLHGDASEWSRSQENIEHLRSINHLAKDWHKSSEGAEWHVKHGKEAWEKREWHKKTCSACNVEYETPWSNKSKYCSDKCRSKMQPKKMQGRQCVICGAGFEAFYYGPTRTCSKQCGLKLRVQMRKQNNGGTY